MPSHGALRQLELFDDVTTRITAYVPPDPADVPERAAAPPPDFSPKPDVASLSSRELSEQASGLAAILGLRKLSKKVSVHWNPRMRTTAGRAHYDAMRIELNPGLLGLPGIDGPAEVDRTLRHELAHLVAHLRACGRRIDPHGLEWRQACSDLGIPGESRCHTLPFRSRQIRRKFLYRCPACGVDVPRVRKFRRPVACYTCCRKHAGGRYDDRYRLKSVPQKSR